VQPVLVDPVGYRALLAKISKTQIKYCIVILHRDQRICTKFSDFLRVSDGRQEQMRSLPGDQGGREAITPASVFPVSKNFSEECCGLTF
jgi:hypothetical protein